MICPLTFCAPSKRALISPERFPVRRTAAKKIVQSTDQRTVMMIDSPYVETGRVLTYSSSFSPRKSLSLASSTRMISFSNGLGDRLMTLQIVRNNVDHASLWKTMTIEVVGNFVGKVFVRQLKGNNLLSNVCDKKIWMLNSTLCGVRLQATDSTKSCRWQVGWTDSLWTSPSSLLVDTTSSSQLFPSHPACPDSLSQPVLVATFSAPPVDMSWICVWTHRHSLHYSCLCLSLLHLQLGPRQLCGDRHQICLHDVTAERMVRTVVNKESLGGLREPRPWLSSSLIHVQSVILRFTSLEPRAR